MLSILYYPVSLIQTEVDDKAIYRSVSEGVISKRVTMTPAARAPSFNFVSSRRGGLTPLIVFNYL
ncbi:hypothetical protein FID62_04315 [Yersinia pestis]|nr:hypothetical protein FID62_04315 [Yersinia pestis]